ERVRRPPLLTGNGHLHLYLRAVCVGVEETPRVAVLGAVYAEEEISHWTGPFIRKCGATGPRQSMSSKPAPVMGRPGPRGEQITTTGASQKTIRAQPAHRRCGTRACSHHPRSGTR